MARHSPLVREAMAEHLAESFEVAFFRIGEMGDIHANEAGEYQIQESGILFLTAYDDRLRCLCSVPLAEIHNGGAQSFDAEGFILHYPLRFRASEMGVSLSDGAHFLASVVMAGDDDE